jgi:pyruvate,water dikinase
MWGSRRHGNQQQGTPFRPLRLLRKLPSILRSGFNASRSKGPRHTPEQFFAQIDQWVNPFIQQDLSQLDDHALWAEGLPVWRERGAYAFATNLRISTPSGLIYALLERIVKWWTGRKELAQDLISSPSGVYSAEVGPALWHMAQIVQEADLQHVLLDNSPHVALTLIRTMPEGQPFIEQLERFLERHGHRCPNELELLNPRWAEAPEQVIELVTNYLQADESINPIAAETRQRQLCAKATEAVEAKLDPLRRAIFRFVLKRAQRAVTVRDNSRYHMTKFIFPMRKLYAQLGQRWAERGWLKQADDIFFLTVSEIQTIIEGGPASVSPQELQTRVANRRLAYQYWFTVVPPDALGPDGTPIVEEEEASNTLKGIPASSGRVRGRARIVQTVYEAMGLTPGDILVTQATDPGWTPVFPLVSGIILEIGGQLSHGAIIAREYAIPAVVNVPGAMRMIHDGQIITIDGTNGYIYL